MARQFLTALNLNKNELLNAKIQNLSTPPSNPVAGQIYFDTDTNQLTLWDGTAWVSLAAGGNVADMITTAIDALTTDDIEEGDNNYYYTEERAKADAAELLTSATLTNITITGDGTGLTITAENGVDDSTTDDLEEGTTNLYYLDSRVDSHLSGNYPIEYSNGDISLAIGSGGGLTTDEGGLYIDRTTVDTWYDPAGAAGDVATDLSDHISDTSTHGVTGDIVGTSDTQTLSNKTVSGSLLFGVDGAEIASTDGALEVHASDDLTLSSGSGDILLDADGGVYVGGAAVPNGRLITQGNLDAYIGDETVTGATGNTITDRITSAASGALSDAQAYADALVQGLNVKDSVRVASATDVDIQNATEVDGVTLVTGDRVLLFGQSTATENGIYTFNTADELVRAADADPVADELGKGSYVLVTNGTYAATGWVVSDLTAGATTWIQFSAANEYTAGDGIDITTNEISVELDGDSLSVSGDGLKVNFNVQGGLDVDSGIFINTGTGLTVNGGNQLTFAAGYGVKKYTDTNSLLTPSSGSVTWAINHNIGVRSVLVQLYTLDTYETVEVDVVRTDSNNVTLSWVAASNVAADSYQAVIIG